MSKSLTKPMRRLSIYDEQYKFVYDDEPTQLDENNIDGTAIHDTRKETMMLAQFLASTGPEEYGKTANIKKQQQFKSAIRLLNRLRKSAKNSDVTTQPSERKKYIPLPVYEVPNNDNNESLFKNETRAVFKDDEEKRIKKTAKDYTNSNNNKRKNLEAPAPLITNADVMVKSKQRESISARDSGVYSEANSEREGTSTAYSPVTPIPVFSSVLNDLQFPRPPFQYKFPENNTKFLNRPAPLPPTAASSAATTPASSSTVSGSTNTSDSSSTRIRSVPEAALNRRSARLRHVQVQTHIDTKKATTASNVLQQSKTTPDACCPHCKTNVTKGGRARRPSCPPSLASGPALLTSKDTEDSKTLLTMILKLKTQLEEEKQCRIRLEKAVRQQQKESDEKKNQLALEKEKWLLDSLWLSDRIAFLPE